MRYFVWNCDELLGRVLLEHIAKTDSKAELSGTLRAAVPDTSATIPGAHGLELPVTPPEPNPLPTGLEVVDGSDDAAVRAALLASDVVVYPAFGEGDATRECEAAARVLHEEAEAAVAGKASVAGPGGKPKKRVFVCVSTVLTWARTRGPGGDEDEEEGEDDENAPGGDFTLTEEDFRRRRAHPAFRHYLATEKAVSRLRVKGHLRTIVVAAGLIYGRGEWMLHPWFKDAWSLRPPALDCYGRGDNVVPTVHVEDLAGVILAACAAEATARYILAVDEADNTLGEICSAVNRELGTGKPIGHLRQDEVLLLRDIELFLVNLRMEATTARDLGYEWRYPEGLVERIGDVVSDFRRRRGLTSLRVFVHGPPASGKSHFASLLARHYHIHHVRVEDAIAEFLAQCDEDTRADLEEAVGGADVLAGAVTGGAGDDGDNDDAGNSNNNNNNNNANGGNGGNGGGGMAGLASRIPDEWMVRIIRGKLRQRGCVNQGYVLDGFPATTEQCELLFPEDEERGGEAEEDGIDLGELAEERTVPDEYEDTWAAGMTDPSDPPKRPPPTRPRFVLTLEAEDEFLADRVMAMPQSRAGDGTGRYDEAGFRSRLQAFRQRNTETNTVINFFEERDIGVVSRRVDDGSVGDSAVMGAMVLSMGRPHNYGPTAEELAGVRRQQQLEEDRKHESRRVEQERVEVTERERRIARDDRERARLEAIKAQETENLNVHALPLRSYLLTNVLPTVTEALIEICKVRPDDPLEYLASYLFNAAPDQVLEEKK